eukprot:TRINITY_DN19707_c0_g1_i1.p1 TRINITY_DN19707_c0_g1~~TRINITY_DN19707_c0_g1_i1.p1  ORF type:complete len:1640 (+),score=433.33 TRINITY_DN19707_c0_g1_i1:58-4977(+)
MPELQKREKVLVQYRLLKDFDELSRRGIPGIDVRVMEDNIYEWHVTMTPISGHFAGLRLHLILLFPEDYPRRPPKVELCTRLPHANVFRNFLTFAGYFAGYEPVRGTYVICTDVLEDKPPPLNPNDSLRYHGWSVAYSVESVLVQLQCLLFDDYVQQEDGTYINTLWDHWYSQPGEGRKSWHQVCCDLHAAQCEADAFVCKDCGFSGMNTKVAFHDKLKELPESGEDDEESNESEMLEEEKVEGEDASCHDGEASSKSKLISRKKQRKLQLQKLKKDKSLNTKVDFKKQNLYLELANSNSALLSGKALRRVPGVFKPRDIVSFYFHGVEDEVYINGHRNINDSLQIFNYGHEVEYPWSSYNIMTGKTVYHKKEPEKKQGEEKVHKGKSDWEKFVNSQGGGSSKKPEDTPGTEAYIRKREHFREVGVVEFVNAYAGTVTIVVAGHDGKLGACGGHVTDGPGKFGWNTEAASNGEKAILFKNVPMQKVKLHGYEQELVPYEHEPPVNYKPFVAKNSDAKRLEYDLEKDVPTSLVKVLEAGTDSLTKQRLATLPEERRAAARPGSVPEQSFTIIDSSATQESFCFVSGQASEDNFEIVSVLGDDSSAFELLSSRGGATASSFDIIGVVEEEQTSSAGGSSQSVRSSWHLVPTELSYALLSKSSTDDAATLARLLAAGDSAEQVRGETSDAGSSVSEVVSNHSLISLWNHAVTASRGWEQINGSSSWALFTELGKLNVPIRAVVKSMQNFGAFLSIDATPRNLAVRNRKLVPAAGLKGKGKGRGKGSKEAGARDSEQLLQDGLLPWLPYMRSAWPEASTGKKTKSESLLVLGNVLADLCEDELLGPREITVYVSEADTEKRRLKLSLQPNLSFKDLRLGEEYDGIVVDCSKQGSLGLFVAISDDLVGLVHRTQYGVGDFSDEVDEHGWYKRCVYKVGDRIKVWVVKKEILREPEGSTSRSSRRNFKIDLTMDQGNAEVRKCQLESCLQVLDEASTIKQCRVAESPMGKTVMDLQLQQSYDKEDKFYLIKNNRLIQNSEKAYPDLVIDYSTDPPPPPPKEDKERFDFSLIQDWDVCKIIEEHKRLLDKQDAYDKADKTKKLPKEVQPLSKEEERLLKVLKKKAEQWGNEYYERVEKKVSDHHKRIKEIYDQIRKEREQYPMKSVIDLDKFRDLTERIKAKGYDDRSCYVTRLSYKEDILGVGLEIKPEADTERNVFHCSFDLLSKEAFYDFGVRSGVWKDKVQFWMPAAIDASHFRRALPHLATCFRQLGDGKVEALTRSYGTQAGSAKYNLKAQLREAERKGQKVVSLEDFRKQEAERKKKAVSPCPSEAPSEEAAPAVGSALGLTEADVAFGLEVLPKLMNLQTVQLMKGDLHLSTKALEGYMGFHHLLLSILRQFPSLQVKVERKIATFIHDEQFRTKKACPNIGEFLCLLAVSRKYTWDDVSKAVLKETLDRNASWAIDKFDVLKLPGISAEVRLEKTFRASIVSIRLLCFNVWFLRNIVFKKYGELSTAESIVAQKSLGAPLQNQVDRRWEEYEAQKGIPKASEVEMLQEEMKKMLLRGDGLNSWRDYFIMLNLKPPRANDLSQLLRMCLNDAVGKGYIPLWKLRPKPPAVKKSGANDFLGDDINKFDGMFTKSGCNKW